MQIWVSLITPIIHTHLKVYKSASWHYFCRVIFASFKQARFEAWKVFTPFFKHLGWTYSWLSLENSRSKHHLLFLKHYLIAISLGLHLVWRMFPHKQTLTFKERRDALPIYVAHRNSLSRSLLFQVVVFPMRTSSWVIPWIIEMCPGAAGVQKRLGAMVQSNGEGRWKIMLVGSKKGNWRSGELTSGVAHVMCSWWPAICPHAAHKKVPSNFHLE